MLKKGNRAMVQSKPGPKLSWPLGPVAHRGLHDAAKGRIENTTSAFAAAIAKGYAIECDVQAALGHEPVVFHDETLDRLMNATGPVAGRTAGDLAKLAYKGGGTDRIPTLAGLLEQIAGRVPLYIEVKTQFGERGAFEARIAECLRHYSGPVALMSFDHQSLIALRGLAPKIPRGLISYRWDDGWMPQMPAEQRMKLRDLAYAPVVAPGFIAYDVDDLPEPAPLELKKVLDIPLLTWTVTTPEQRACCERYADAMIFEGFEP